MFSFRLALVAATALVAQLAAATDYPIDPPSVPLATRRNWCTSETTQCPLICLDTGSSGKPRDNSCDPMTLNYACVCSNGNSPNLTEYSLTMPYHKCTQFQVNCVAACGLADNQCSENCRVNNPCGAASPKGASASGSAAVVAPSSTSAAPNTIQTGFAGAGGSNSNTGSGANMAAPLSLGAAITALLVAPFLVL
ncbi:hypothetical protein MCOR27_010692 [Pyricularia oryzae]|uniref:DUF7707 domain-containing protein n=5 Tax=Pyricularia TaxID=48558 RepID=A0ABQ8NI09_PYRGI|nr:uncharacterized protein MGG_03691 [Pyricularia oryzae 70-15]ELQ38334.1 hypothetical protein OOU_Y34scaffold00542g26 [Pyricularia oryzae Y34]KAH8844398.1 hypothetical protein MCOR01_005143 [Pyricularia oryzae]KAI6297403.1 hypothetical protein MCOR33_006238 [Pyricularia grisea]EHA49871.1 hypothetical protein MGG_03691 [Pyricularia oryzae 70-15]KAH9431909.1 hypothetical protein MCOR02_009175 [Pyricularia oryzae]